MNLENIIPLGKNEYAIKTTGDLEILSSYAYIGSKAYCIENEKMYIYIGVNEWVSM